MAWTFIFPGRSKGHSSGLCPVRMHRLGPKLNIIQHVAEIKSNLLSDFQAFTSADQGTSEWFVPMRTWTPFGHYRWIFPLLDWPSSPGWPIHWFVTDGQRENEKIVNMGNVLEPRGAGLSVGMQLGISYCVRVQMLCTALIMASHLFKWCAHFSRLRPIVKVESKSASGSHWIGLYARHFIITQWWKCRSWPADLVKTTFINIPLKVLNGALEMKFPPATAADVGHRLERRCVHSSDLHRYKFVFVTFFIWPLSLISSQVHGESQSLKDSFRLVFSYMQIQQQIQLWRALWWSSYRVPTNPHESTEC